MEQTINAINLDAILWIGGGFATVIVLLLGWIAYLQRSINGRLELRMDGQDLRMDKHEDEIHELALSNRETLTIIKHKLKIK